MTRPFAVILLLLVGLFQRVYATGGPECANLLQAKPNISNDEKNLNLVIEQIRRAGVQELLRPFDEGQLKLKISAWRAPWQSPVAARVGWFGGSSLKLRDFRFTNEKERQILVWRTAVSLFELQTRYALWSRRSVFTPDDKREFDLSMRGESELFEYFLFQQPKEWRDVYLAQLERLEADLYRLYQTLPVVQSEGLLAEKNPDRFGMLTRLWGGDGGTSRGPNQADFDAWKTGSLAQQLEHRHGRPLLFDYYMNFLKRMTVISTALMIVSAVPDLPIDPESVQVSSQIQRTLDEAPARLRQAESPRPNEAFKILIKEQQRLKEAIEEERHQQNPRGEVIQSLEAALTDLGPSLLNSTGE